MNSAPRLSLRTLFLLFFCAAVGLTIHPSPAAALEPAIATAIVIGLIQQVRQLFSWYPSADERSSAIAFAQRFAITWRLFIIAVIATCVVIDMLVSKGIVPFPPDHDDQWFYLQYAAILPLCIVVTVCNSLARWRSSLPIRAGRRWRPAGLWAFGIFVGIVLLIDGTGVQFLVHKGVAGIEAAQKYRRPGIYPNLADEQYRSIWLASAAVVSLITAGAMLVWSSKERND
jgi:hypothetical protein